MKPQAAPQHPYLTGAPLAIATISLALATFMNVLDTTIANVSIPHIAGDLSVSPNQGTWIITSYAVATAIVVPLSGWLARRFGEVRLFVTCTLLFSLASALCGLAPTFSSLVNFRALQGAVAGPMIPISQALLLKCYPPEKKGLALGFWSITTVVAPIIGPIMGGWITDNHGWEWIFYINVPVGFACSYITWNVLKERETTIVKQPVDKVGLALLAIWVGCLQLCLDAGQQEDWFDSPRITALAVTSFVGFVFFIAWELMEEHPIVDLAMFKNRNYTVATIAISLGYMAFFGNAVLIPLWLQTQMGYTALWAGLASAPIGVFTLILTPIVANNLHRMDLRWIATFAFSVFAFTSFWQASFNTDITFGGVALPRLMQGLGMACFFVPMTTISLSDVPHEKIASAAGMTNFVRILGGSFGTSLVITIWGDRISHHRTMLTENISSYNSAWNFMQNRMENMGMSVDGALQMVSHIVDRQSVMLATDDLFYLTGVLFTILIGFTWFSQRVRIPVKDDAAPPPVGEA